MVQSKKYVFGQYLVPFSPTPSVILVKSCLHVNEHNGITESGG